MKLCLETTVRVGTKVSIPTHVSAHTASSVNLNFSNLFQTPSQVAINFLLSSIALGSLTKRTIFPSIWLECFWRKSTRIFASGIRIIFAAVATVELMQISFANFCCLAGPENYFD